MALEQALNIRIPEELLAKAFTVKELILEIEKLAPGKGFKEGHSAGQEPNFME